MIDKVHVKKNDQVAVISGPEGIKGKQGKVLTVFPATGRVVVEGVAYVSKHQKSRRQDQQGGIYQKERAIDASNVMLICPKCGKPTREAHKFLKDGTKERICKKCGEII